MAQEIEKVEENTLATPETLEFLKTPRIRNNYLQVGQGMSEAVKLSIVRQGEFYLTAQQKERCLPVGTFEKENGKFQGKISLLYGAWRPKAVLLVDNEVAAEVYDPKDPKFESIMYQKSQKRDTNVKSITPMWGTEVLVYIPPIMFNWDNIQNNPHANWDIASITPVKQLHKNGCAAIFFFCKENRTNSFAGEYDFGQALVFRSDLHEGKYNSWWKTPDRYQLDTDEAWINDGKDILNSALNVFQNPVPVTQMAEVVEVINDDR